MDFKLKSSYVVEPAEATKRVIIPLTELDQVGTITHTSTVYFYERPTNDWLNNSHEKIVHILRDSMSRALVPFYPLAGRLRCVGSERFELECNAKGAELIEVECSKKIAQFGDFSSPRQFFRELLPRIDYTGKPIHEHPVLVVQVTWFGCGGISIGISMSHVVIDGKSAFHFIKEWARLARGEQLEVVPYLDRQVLQANHPYDKHGVGQYVDSVNYFRSLVHLGDAKCLEQREVKKVVPISIVLTKDEIERMKKEANREMRSHDGGGLVPYGRLEVVAAHVWRCVCKARGLRSEETMVLALAIDARNRMEPPLPPSYFGNAVLDVEISSNVRDLMTKPLSYACSKVREAIQKVTSEYVFTTINFFKYKSNLANYRFIEDQGNMEGPSAGDNKVILTSWLNLPARGVDFGWGKEIYVGPPVSYGCDGDALVYSHKNNDGSLVVVAWLIPKEKFLNCVSRVSIGSKI